MMCDTHDTERSITEVLTTTVCNSTWYCLSDVYKSLGLQSNSEDMLNNKDAMSLDVIVDGVQVRLDFINLRKLEEVVSRVSNPFFPRLRFRHVQTIEWSFKYE